MRYGRIRRKRRFQEREHDDKHSDHCCIEICGESLNSACFLFMCTLVNGLGLGKWHLLSGAQMPRKPTLDQKQMVSAGLNGID